MSVCLLIARTTALVQAFMFPSIWSLLWHQGFPQDEDCDCVTYILYQLVPAFNYWLNDYLFFPCVLACRSCFVLFRFFGCVILWNWNILDVFHHFIHISPKLSRTCLETSGSPLEFKIKFCVCEPCWAAQLEFAMVDPGRSAEFKGSARRIDILTVFLEGLGAGDRSATVTVEGWIFTANISVCLKDIYTYTLSIFKGAVEKMLFCWQDGAVRNLWNLPVLQLFTLPLKKCNSLTHEKHFFNAAPDSYCTWSLRIRAICWFSCRGVVSLLLWTTCVTVISSCD